MDKLRPRDVRRLAMQVLYQMDLTGAADAQQVGENLDEQFDSQAVRAAALGLAESAWADHEQADKLATQLAPRWPTHRQPPVDRAIMRLAYHEMASGRTPVKVAINEAVELAKAYGAKQSATFINGVLDKMAKSLDPAGAVSDDQPANDREARCG
jgi:N utilization substance protein B